jgi:hypothetical protein
MSNTQTARADAIDPMFGLFGEWVPFHLDLDAGRVGMRVRRGKWGGVRRVLNTEHSLAKDWNVDSSQPRDVNYAPALLRS